MNDWMRLDTDYWHDPKFVLLIKEKGEAVAWRALKVLAHAYRAGGEIDLNDPMARTWAEDDLNIRGKAFTSILKTMAHYGLITPENLERGIVSSRRLTEERLRIDDLRAKKSAAGRASGEARRKRKQES